MLGDEAAIVVQGEISLPSETVEGRHKTSVLFVDARPHEINDRDVVARLTPRPLSDNQKKLWATSPR
jgi:hypothetical protein